MKRLRLAMAQMSMTDRTEENLEKSLRIMEQASDCDLIFFPEIQFSPFFPKHPGRDASRWRMTLEDDAVRRIRTKSEECRLYCSPNLYLSQNGGAYDASLWITPQGEIEGISKMVHILQAERFYERDYYTPSEDGFRVYDTPFGRIGIVICFDRHMPESIRSCALQGAQLVIIPTANIVGENLELFEWELRVQAMQNTVFLAMCNRVGQEEDIRFAGQSLVVDPDGNRIVKADGTEQLIKAELDLSLSDDRRRRRPYLTLCRPELYTHTME